MLARHALDRIFRPHTIRHLALAPAETKLAAIPAKMLPADVMERAMHTAFEESEVGLSRVGVCIALGILALAVVHRLMTAREVSPDPLVRRELVRHDGSFLAHHFLDRAL